MSIKPVIESDGPPPPLGTEMAKQPNKKEVDADMLTIDGSLIDNSPPEDLKKERQDQQSRGSRNARN